MSRLQVLGSNAPCLHTEAIASLTALFEGGSKFSNRIIQLSAEAVSCDGKKVGADFNKLVFTTQPISKHAYDVHKISAAMLRGKDGMDVVGAEFVRWLEPLVAGKKRVVLVAHNGFNCDFRMLSAELQRHGLELPGGVEWMLLDTLTVIKKVDSLDYHKAPVAVWPERNKLTKDQKKKGDTFQRPSLNLKSVTNYILSTRQLYKQEWVGDTPPTFNTYCGQAHDALADTRALRVMLTDPQGLWSRRGNMLLRGLGAF